MIAVKLHNFIAIENMNKLHRIAIMVNYNFNILILIFLTMWLAAACINEELQNCEKF